MLSICIPSTSKKRLILNLSNFSYNLEKFNLRKKIELCLHINGEEIKNSEIFLLAKLNIFEREVQLRQEIGDKYTQKLNKKGLIEGKKHKKVYRPWGSYLSVDNASLWKIKKIEVNPGASLSLQMHFHRSEHWIVINGTAKVEIDNIVKIIAPNESAYIPLGVKHRLLNPTKFKLTLIEIQSGSYLGEDDIKRFEDKYGR